MPPARRFLEAAGVLGALVLLAGCQHSHAATDTGWAPTVLRPTHSVGVGPQVTVDAGHGNWHTIKGRFRPFADLLQLDGYRVSGAKGPITPDRLRGLDLFVVANPVLGGESAKWVLPTPPAYTKQEAAVLERWVAEGGSLLLIADHMPFPGAAQPLAAAFGLEFLNGYALPAVGAPGELRFDRAAGTLADHQVTRGRDASEAVPFVTSFTGQAFRAPQSAARLMLMPDDWKVFLPEDADNITVDTAQVSTRGLVQGALFRHGKGRVAAFGEAAMFSAQTGVRDGQAFQFGMNSPKAPHNAQFVLNVVRWLTEDRGAGDASR